MSTVYYSKNSSGTWAQAFVDQGTPTCVLVNQFNFTTQIIPQCYNAKNQLTANANP
jgi:hypothetical protein